jgi:hypothetical protein
MAALVESSYEEQDYREWEDADKSSSCARCNKQFGVMIWKHHCRACGRVMCKKCTNYFTRIPVSELCPGCPDYVDPKYAQRCCIDCSTRVRARQAEVDFDAPRQPPHAKPIVGVRIIDSLDYVSCFHSKVYRVQIPSTRTVFPNQIVRVVLGGRVNRVVIPEGVQAGDVMYVRGNDVQLHYPSQDYCDDVPHVLQVDTSVRVDEVRALAKSLV